MGRKVQRVCAACTNNCPLFHETNKTSPTSFFKVMAKEEYLRTLYIPPDFSSTVSDLVNKKIIVKDSSGKQWKVKISKVNGSFAFEEGWNVFSLDHRLEVGYLLVFNYIKGSHFDVKIYDPSTCERLDFCKRINQEKSRCRSGSPVRDGMLVAQGPNALIVSESDVPKMKSQHMEVDLVETQNSIEIAQPMCISEHYEDPCYLTNIEFEDKERDDPSCGNDGTMKIANGDLKVSNVDYGSHKFQNDATICNKDPMLEEILGMGAALDASEHEMSGRNNSLGETNKNTYGKTSALKLEENIENKVIMFKREAQECQVAEGLGEMKKVAADMTPKPCCSMDKLSATGAFLSATSEEICYSLQISLFMIACTCKLSKRSKKELVTLDELGAAELPEENKGKLGHSSRTFNQDDEIHFKTASTLSFAIPKDNNGYLKLPTWLPLNGKATKRQRMVVLLRDPVRRLWPVFYHKQPRLNLLTHGWLDFCRANNIQPADVCYFEAEPENKSQRILAVHIAHK
ncbi:hypothetical protein VNO77_09550 [Canavalia gladiata]|uniref:TF-B3 domain-containing protein n=1 Tax=Canavalia gladiata TaxID=3824 RepID=A0AAN9MD53_CANGL